MATPWFKSAFSDDYTSIAKQQGWCPTCGDVWYKFHFQLLKIKSMQMQGKVKPGQVAHVKWGFHFGDVITSAAMSCQFCCFVARRFFHHSHDEFFQLGSAAPTQGWVGCCSQRSFTPKPEDVVVDIAKAAQKFLKGQTNPATDGDWFVMHLIPSHSSGKALPDFDKLRLELHETDLDAESLQRILGCRRSIDLEVFALPETPAAVAISSRPPKHIRGDPSTFEVVRKWMSDCIDTHDDCPKLQVSRLPTRVVEILDETNLRLHVSTDDAPYTILSYSWGGPQVFTTTEATVTERCNGFSVSDLPKTLQEAVVVTRELGVKYIWIDALCILQDSNDDKERELPQMPRYYGNAYVTISASIAKSSDKEFLKISGGCEDHPSYEYAKDLFEVPYRAPLPITLIFPVDKSDQEAAAAGADPENFHLSFTEGALSIESFDSNQLEGAFGRFFRTTQIYMREEIPYSNFHEPISHRAWTLQERLLSPRLLSYGMKLIWFCRSARRCDGGVEDWSFDEISNSNQSISSFTFRGSPRNNFSDVFSKTQLYKAWRNVVTEYCRREMTFESDKLPAISGMASVFYEITGDKYLAGLWKQNLAHELMWTTNPSVEIRRPSKWRAPSWSWASVENLVAFDRLSEDSKMVCRIIDCKVDLKSATAPFSEVSGGALVIEGSLIKAKPADVRNMMRDEATGPMTHESKDDKELKKHTLLFPSAKTDTGVQNNWQIDMDVLMKAPKEGSLLDYLKSTRPEWKWTPPDDVWCLVLFVRNWYWDRFTQQKAANTVCYSGLVLKQAESNNRHYERIGSFHNQKCTWLGGGTQEMVCVV